MRVESVIKPLIAVSTRTEGPSVTHFNTSAITENNADFVFMGAPKQYYGLAVVGFFDILGYRASIKQTWSNSSDSPAARLVHLRDHFDGSPVQSTTMSFYTPGQPRRRYFIRVHTIADAFTISTAIPSEEGKFQTADLMMAFYAAVSNTLLLWGNILEQGFTIRGAIEFGQVYWDDRTIVGPAQVDAYWLESKICRESRVLFGPTLLQYLGNIQKSGTGPDMFDQIAGSVKVHEDGLPALDELGMQKHLQRVTSLREASGPHTGKYDNLISRLDSINQRVEAGSHGSGTTWEQVAEALSKLQAKSG
jgi:hypothetical protein